MSAEDEREWVRGQALALQEGGMLPNGKPGKELAAFLRLIGRDVQWLHFLNQVRTEVEDGVDAQVRWELLSDVVPLLKYFIYHTDADFTVDLDAAHVTRKATEIILIVERWGDLPTPPKQGDVEATPGA